MKAIVLLLFLLGIIFIITGYQKSYMKCEPKTKYIYRYVPRNFIEEQMEPQSVEDAFKTMFKNPSPWVGKFPEMEIKKGEDINKNFISQYGFDDDENDIVGEVSDNI